MESSDVIDCAVRVKEEPSDASFLENDRYMTDEKPDLKNFQFLPFPRENSTHTLRKCEENYESELNDEIEIIFQCEDVKPKINLSAVNKIKTASQVKKEFFGDVAEEYNLNFACELKKDMEIVFECENSKPNINLLAVKKIDDYTPYNLHNLIDSDKIQNIMKIESTREVKQEFMDDTTKKSTRRINCELVEQKEKSKLTNIGSTHDNRKPHQCDKCGKTLSQKYNLKKHIASVHNRISHPCHLCGKTFLQKGYVKIHIDIVHNDITQSCDVCGKSFKLKSSLKNHIDMTHKGVTFVCDLCGKTFLLKRSLQRHIDSIHSKIAYSCDVCGKSFSQKWYRKAHIDEVHNGVTHACDICRKKYTQKGNLKVHIDTVHNGTKHTCDICRKKYLKKGYLKKHMESVHNKITHA